MPNNKKSGQKYQNVFKFKHNKNSAKTEKILNSPLDNLCQRCLEIIKWKIAYRKYKPLTAMAKCNLCQEKNIIKAYRTICDKCAVTKEKKLCTKCGHDCAEYATPPVTNKDRKDAREKLEQEMDDVLKSLRERCKRTVLRKIETGEVTYDQKRKMFIYKETDEEFKVDQKGDNDSDDEGSHHSGSAGNSDSEDDEKILQKIEQKKQEKKLKKETEAVEQKEEDKKTVEQVPQTEELKQPE